MRLSTLSDYAVVILSAAVRGGAADGRLPAKMLSAAMLSAETGVPLPTAQKLMGRLASAGLLTSARGTGGGFALARDAGAISLAEIIEAIEGPIAMTVCADESRHDCVLEDACRVRPHMPSVNDAVRGALGGVSLATLAGVH